MNVNDGLLALERVFSEIVPYPASVDQVAHKLHMLAEYRDASIPTIIRRADDLGIWVREDGKVYIR